MADEWLTEPLTTQHELGHLNSGRPDIDDWLSQHAVRLQRDGTCATSVWCDGQFPYVYGFYSLMPHSLVPDPDTKISGYTGGALSGYLIAKIGIHRDAIDEDRTVTSPDGEVYEMPIAALLIIEALVDMEHAAGTAGGRWAFVDTANEPETIIQELAAIGFKPINRAGSTTWFLKLGNSHSSIR